MIASTGYKRHWRCMECGTVWHGHKEHWPRCCVGEMTANPPEIRPFLILNATHGTVVIKTTTSTNIPAPEKDRSRKALKKQTVSWLRDREDRNNRRGRKKR